MADKLYLVTRADLSAGQQAVQACHAMTGFLVEHKDEATRWYSTSNYLALLAVPDEHSLVRLAHKAKQRGLHVFSFHEPDRGGALTAIALESSAKGLLRDLKLALTGV